MRYLLSAIVVSFLLIGCSNNAATSNGKYLLIKGKKIYYEEYGKGSPLILLSGGGISRSIDDFNACIPELSKHYRVIAPDSPGQGKSEQADTISYVILTEYISQFIDSLQVDSAYVMGWSDGGITALLLAADKSDKIKKVIAVGANNGLKGAVPSFIPLDSIQPLSIKEWEQLNKSAIADYMNKLPRDWKKLMRQYNLMWYQKDRYFSESVYDRIKIPVMIVLGDRDDINLEHGIEMHRRIEGSQFCVLPNTSHEVFTESPEQINQIAIKFFHDNIN